jgi:hypothetical protein
VSAPAKHPGGRPRALTPAQVAEIRALAPTCSRAWLATHYGVGATTVYEAARGCWPAPPAVRHTHEGLTVGQWAARTGIGVDTLRARLRLGWTLADAVATPVDARRRPWRQPAARAA